MVDETKILYKFDKSHHISYNRNFICCVGSKVNLYDIHSGKLISKFKDVKQPNYSKFTSNQNLIVKTTRGNYYIYDLASMNLVKTIPPPKNVSGSITNFQITSDNKYIIDFSYVFPTYKLMIIDIQLGTHTYFDLGYARGVHIFSTETESKYYVITSCAETIDSPDVSVREYYELSYKSGEFKLQRLYFDRGRLAAVDYNSNIFAIWDYSNKIKIFNAQNNSTDELEYYNNGALYDLKLSKNGRYLALAESQNIYIYDLNNKECVKTYEVEYGCFVDFLDDERLLIGTWEKGYCVSIEPSPCH